MKTKVFSRFQHTLENLTRTGCLLVGEGYNPETQITAFEEVVRLLRIPKGAIARSGDHILFNDRHYVLSSHSDELYSENFRLIPLPDQVVWKIRPVQVVDVVSGLLKDFGPMITTQAWVRRLNGKEEPEVGKAKGRAVRFVCGSSIQPGDVVDGVIIRHVYQEQGVMVAEA